MNPFDLSGPAFLAFHAVLWLVGLILAVFLHRQFRQPNDLGPEEPPLHPYEVAHLAGGATLAVNAALVRLVDIKRLLHDATTDKLTRNPEMTEPPSKPHEVDQVLLNMPGEFTVKEAREACAAEMGKMRQRLQGLGLETTAEAAASARWWPFWIMIALFALGVTKIFVGIERHKPVIFLVITSVFTLIVAIAFLARRVVRTGRGEQLLAALRARHDALRVAAAQPAGALSSSDLPLAVGLFGAGALAGAGYAHMRRALQPPTNQAGGCGGGAYYSDIGGGCGGGCGGASWGSADGGWSSGGGGGDAGGGGGGDGGGGGGGCGGCGGGGCGGGGGD